MLAMGRPLAIFLLFLLTTCAIAFTSINNKLHEVHFEYPGPAVSERDLPVCPPHAVCSVIHRRFWAAPVVERLCRCLRRLECPWQWTFQPDNYTMHLDNRSQLKFCDEVTDLPECTAKRTALSVAMTKTLEPAPAQVPGHDRTSSTSLEEEKKLAVNASCLCPPTYSWRNQPQKDNITVYENGTTVQTTFFRCKELRKCNSQEMCGNMRADYFSIYYRCSCPMDHMCINQNRTLINATELLYTGPAYRTYCIPNNPNQS